MRPRVPALAGAAALWIAAAGLTAATGQEPAPVDPIATARAAGWRIPDSAATEPLPSPVDEARLASGAKIFAAKCQRCHGPEGRGDGPDAAERARARMNLTDPARAALNPDGVVFYKVWYGRSSPRMPALGEELSRDQVWMVVAHVQRLRETPNGWR